MLPPASRARRHGPRDMEPPTQVISNRLYQILTTKRGPHMSQSFTNLLYHIIFSTKDRRPIITLDHQTRLYEYIGGVVRGNRRDFSGHKRNGGSRPSMAKLRPDRALSDVLRE